MANSFLNRIKSCAIFYAGFFIFISTANICFAAHTKNILLTGYWPPTNEMLRKFSQNLSQNPGGWQGQNWEGSGYDVYAFFPEFPGGTGSNPKGNGDFEIDYQDVGSWPSGSSPSGDFWRITGLIHPVAIMSYGQGTGPWEIEMNARNLPSASWSDDYSSPTKPTPAPPDTTQSSGYVRHSTLPVEAIAEAVNSAGASLNAWIDWDVNPGAFLCEYMAYHDGWYQSLHSDPCDPCYCVAAGFTHLASGVTPSNGTLGVEAALRALIKQLDLQLEKYTISGTVTSSGPGLAGVTMCGLPGNPVTNSSGIYTAQVGGGWSGAVTPLKSGYAFTQKTYSNVSANQSTQDYTASAATADTIVFDATSNASSATAGTTLSWSHTVGSGNNRVLVVSVVTEDSVAADQRISSVKFNGVDMTLVSGSTKSRTAYSGSSYSSTLRTDLYYMLNPPVGTYTVLITHNGSVSYRAGGAISLNNVKQQVPEAIVTNSATSASISTNIDVPNTGARIVDVVGHSNSGTFTSSTTTERWDKNSGYHTGAGGTKTVTTSGTNTISWTFSGSSGAIVHSLAAFAPSETVGTSPPGAAIAPNPANATTNVSLTPTLSWTAGSGATSHDVYFGTAASPSFIGNQAGTSYTPGTLTTNKTYYWRIDEKNTGGTTTGTVWSFTTVPPSPGAASSPVPSTGATNVSLTQDLSWTAGSGVTSHDVYFGTVNPPPFIQNQAGTTYDTGTMANNKTYYWRIDEKNAGGTTTGTVWSFTTIPKRTLTSSSGNGGDVTTPGEGVFQYDHGTVVNLIAASTANYHFVNWTGTAVTAGKVANPNAASTTITMDGDYTVVANFAIDQKTLISSSTDGGNVTTPGEGSFSYNYGTAASIVAAADTGYHFVNWTGTAATAGKVANPNLASTTVTMDANYTVVANFAITQYTVTASADTNGSIVPSGTITKNYGESQLFSATVFTGYSVDKWFVDGNEAQAGGNTYTLNNITTGHTVAVTFVPIEYSLTINIVGNGSVGKSPQKTTYHYGDTVQLTANPDAGWSFASWSGDVNGINNPKTITIDSNKSVTATFTQNEYTLNVSIVGNGSVVKNPDKTTYHYGDVVQLTANPVAGYSLSSWSGDLTGNTNPANITINGNKSVTATFNILTYTITASAGVNGSISPSGTIIKNYGTNQSFTAAPATGYSVNKWLVDGNEVQSGGTAYTLSNISANHTATVTFIPIEYTLTITTVGSGSVAKSPDKTTYHYGDVVQLTANPVIGWIFNSWSGNLSGSTNPSTLTINSNKAVTATFNIQTFTISGSTGLDGVTMNGLPGNPVTSGGGLYSATVNYGWSGTVTPSKTGYTFSPANKTYTSVAENHTGDNYVATPIEYTLTVTTVGSGSVAKSPDKTTYHYGDVVQLTANPSAGYSFTSWSGNITGSTNPATITINSNKTVTATFAVIEYTITINITGSGTVAKSPNKSTYHYGDIVHLTANPSAGYSFSSWSGDLTGSTNPANITINGNNSVSATFNIPTYNITASADANGLIIPSGTITKNYGESQLFTANVFTGYAIDKWFVDGNEIQTGGNTYTLSNITAGHTVAVSFKILTYTISGIVTEDGIGIDGVIMNGLPGNPVTSSSGLYSATVDYGWSGRITPLRYAYGFEPNSRTYSNVTSDQNDQDYTGRLMTFVISGFIRNDCNIPISDVEVNAGNGSGSSITDANGYYEVWVSYNWSGIVTPGNKPHYTFEPTGIEYTGVLENQTGQDFVATNIYDLDCDGLIGYGDIAVMGENWLQSGSNIPGDFDKNNIVNFLDFAEFAAVW